MSEYARCVVIEWGLGFILLLAFILVLGSIGIAIAFKYFSLRPPVKGGGTFKVKFGKYQGSLSGSGYVGLVCITTILIISGVLITSLYSAYTRFKETYSVAFDTSGGALLEQIKDKFQSDTQATFELEGDVGKIIIKGTYSGYCVADLFSAICRQYNSQLLCDISCARRHIKITPTKAR